MLGSFARRASRSLPSSASSAAAAASAGAFAAASASASALALASAAPAAARRPLASLAHLAHLQGRPPTVDEAAGTFAAFYYKNIREHDTPTKDHIVAFGQDERFTVGAFDVSAACNGAGTTAAPARGRVARLILRAGRCPQLRCRRPPAACSAGGERPPPDPLAPSPPEPLSSASRPSPLSVSARPSRLQRQVYAYALGLLDGLGLRKGSSVAIWMTGELEHLVVRYAAALVGATAVEIDPRLGTEAVLAILAREECRVLFASARFGGQDRLAELSRAFAAELAPAVAEGGALPLASKRLRSLKFLVCASAEFVEGVVRLRDLPVFGSDGSYDQDDVAAVQSFLAKSDTLTVPYAVAPAAAGGFARGSPLSHAQLLGSAAAAAKALALGPADVLLSTAPLHAEPGLAAGPLAAAAAGAKFVLPSKTFDAAKALAAASQQKASVLVALPEHVAPLAAELARDEGRAAPQRLYALGALRAGVVLGAPAGGAAGSLGKLALKGVQGF